MYRKLRSFSFYFAPGSVGTGGFSGIMALKPLVDVPKAAVILSFDFAPGDVGTARSKQEVGRSLSTTEAEQRVVLQIKTRQTSSQSANREGRQAGQVSLHIDRYALGMLSFHVAVLLVLFAVLNLLCMLACVSVCLCVLCLCVVRLHM